MKLPFETENIKIYFDRESKGDLVIKYIYDDDYDVDVYLNTQEQFKLYKILKEKFENETNDTLPEM